MKQFFLTVLIFFCLLACDSQKQDRANHLLELGAELEKMHLPDSALIIYQEAIKILKDTKNDTISGIIYNRIGDLLFSNDLYTEIFEPYSKALPYNARMNDQTEASRSLRGMGKSFLFRFINDSAIVYFKKTFPIYSRIYNKEEKALIHNNLSLAYSEIGKYNLSLYHNEKSILLSSDSINIYKNYSIRGFLFMQTGQYDSAAFYYKSGYQTKNIRTKASCVLGLSKYAKAINSEDSAMYINIFRILKDSIERSAKPFDILHKDKQYQVAETLKKEKAKSIFQIVGILLASLFLLLIFIGRQRKGKKRLEQLNREMKNKQVELTELQHKQEIRLFQKNEELKYSREKESELKKHVFKTDPTIRKIEMLNTLKSIQRIKAEHEYILTAAELGNLEKAVDLRYDNFTGRLRTNYPKLTNDDIQLCCLIKMKVPNKNILTLLNTNELTLKKRRYRIKNNKMELPETMPTLDDYLSDF